MRLSDNIYQVCGRMYGSHQNIYLLTTPQGNILIDSGLTPKDLEIIHKVCNYWHLDQPVKAVLLTGENKSQINNAAYFQNQGAKILASQPTCQAVEKGKEWIGDYLAPEIPFKSFHVDEILNDSISLCGLTFESKNVPGPSDGATLLFTQIDDKRVCFSGEFIKLTELCHKIVLSDCNRIDFSEKKYFASLKNISTQQADMLLPGDGEVSLKNSSVLFPGAYLMARQKFSTNFASHPVEVNYADI